MLLAETLFDDAQLALSPFLFPIWVFLAKLSRLLVRLSADSLAPAAFFISTFMLQLEAEVNLLLYFFVLTLLIDAVEDEGLCRILTD